MFGIGILGQVIAYIISSSPILLISIIFSIFIGIFFLKGFLETCYIWILKINSYRDKFVGKI
jgi:hypothetical protein